MDLVKDSPSSGQGRDAIGSFLGVLQGRSSSESATENVSERAVLRGNAGLDFYRKLRGDRLGESKIEESLSDNPFLSSRPKMEVLEPAKKEAPKPLRSPEEHEFICPNCSNILKKPRNNWSVSCKCGKTYAKEPEPGDSSCQK